MQIKALTGLRPAPDKVAQIASLPYDVVSTNEAKALAEGNSLSMLHVVRAEIDFPDGADPYADAVYAKAVDNLKELVDGGALVQQSEPSLYLYQQVMGDHCQRGLAVLCNVEDYDKDLIKKHEKTRPVKENDRTRLTSDLSANPGPVFLTYRDDATINSLVESAAEGEPLYDFTADDGIRHTVWQISGGEQLINSFKGVPCFYVADGHHRAASAARVGRERKQANPNHDGNEEYNWFLAVLFPASELKVLAYNRVVSDLNGLSKVAYLEKVEAIFEISKTESKEPAAKGNISMYLDGEWHSLKLPVTEGADPVSNLDVSKLQNDLLEPVLGIDDPRTNTRIDFIGGIRGTEELEKLVDTGMAAVAFSMYPVSIDELMHISDADQIMAPKSTWFEPKLRSGLFVHTF